MRSRKFYNRNYGLGSSKPLPNERPWTRRGEYRYQELPNRGRNYIRIATIHPGVADQEIHITLRNERLNADSHPVYEALSYTWGPLEKVMIRVRLEHQEHSRTQKPVVRRGWTGVRSNLLAALKQLRYKDKPRDVWIDAICIDQKDDIHKGAQVAMMGEIFSLASRVIIWLGPEGENSNHAMELMHILGVQVDVDWEARKMTVPEDRVLDPKSLELGTSDEMALHHLFQREWFNRLWIRQEIFRAKQTEAVAYCGSAHVPWHIFRRGWYFVHQKRQLIPLLNRLNDLWGFLAQSGENTSSLSSLRRNFGFGLCQDPRDRIYAIRSLLRDSLQDAIRPDYTKPFEEVYRDAVLAYIRVYDNLDILNQCHYLPEWRGPSWVPDWTLMISIKYDLRPQMASGMIRSPMATGTGATGASKLLRATGVRAATVTKLNRATFEWSKSEKNIRAVRALLREQDSSSSSSSSFQDPYPAGGIVLEAYVQTMCDGRFFDQAFASASYPREDVANLVFRKMSDLLPEEFDDDVLRGLLDAADPDRAFHRVLSRIQMTCLGRLLIHTAEGLIGLASDNTEIGDEVWSLLGCEQLMMLRPRRRTTGNPESSGYLVIGPCYIHGLVYGEAILGQFPDTIRPRAQYGGTGTGYLFEDLETGNRSPHDPRLDSLYNLDLDLDIALTQHRQAVQNGEWPYLCVDSGTLRPVLERRGVELQCIDLA
ncbi:heterokaryon incompatibility protein-domain-containing protein [Xylariaceae sp. FL0255]|nr:heterokaryon incompatibility protein-domain-containing protein [Xylariaceae sp. FL0255]